MIESPFTVDELLAGANKAFLLPENVPQERSKPRVSSICRDAREIAYMMANTEKSEDNEVKRSDSVLTTEQGRMYEWVVTNSIASMGYYVGNSQVSLPDDYPLTGHPDGMLWFPTGAEDATCTWGDFDNTTKGETYDADGMTWGLEVKHYGRWAYENILKKGLEEAAPDVVAQCALYGDALGWDACLVVVTSQDASSIRSDITRNRKAKNPAIRWADRPGIHPKVTLVALDLRPLYETLVPVLKHRAEWFTQWKEQDGNPANVKWEIYPGDDKFPWSYSEWQGQAIADGQGMLEAPGLPWTP